MRKFENLFQIGEVAALYNISRKMLLNYEKNGLLTPTAVDEYSGYRYYDGTVIARVGLILDLRKTGMAIPDIRDYLLGKTTTEMQIRNIREQIKALHEADELLSIRNIKQNGVSAVTETMLPAAYCVCKKLVAADIANAVGEFSSLYLHCLKKGYSFSGGIFNFCEFYVDILSPIFFQTDDIEMSICIVVNADNSEELTYFPQTKALAISYCGRYEDSYIAYEKLRKYIVDNGLRVVGYPREYYIEGSFNELNDHNIVRITVPIA